MSTRITKKIRSKRTSSILRPTINKRSTRTRTRTAINRLGVNPINANGDNFFEQLINSQQVIPVNLVDSSTAESTTNTSHSTNMSNVNLNVDSPLTTSDSNDAILSISSEDFSTFRGSPINMGTHSLSPDTLEAITIENSSTSTPNNNKNDSFQVAVLNNMKEILVRIKAVEKHVARIDVRFSQFINNQTSKKMTTIGTVDPVEMTMLGLPAKNQQSLEILEAKLEDENYMKNVFKALMKIGGDTGDNDRSKVLEPIVHALIAPILLSSISWSGRAGKGKSKKIALSKYAGIVRIICSLCQKADKSSDSEQCIKDIKYKIIKYAYEKYSDNNSVLISTATSPEENIEENQNEQPGIEQQNETNIENSQHRLMAQLQTESVQNVASNHLWARHFTQSSNNDMYSHQIYAPTPVYWQGQYTQSLVNHNSYTPNTQTTGNYLNL